jgi:hypothetical protein
MRSFEIAELLLLFGAENVENLGLHAAFATISLASRLASVSARALTCFSFTCSLPIPLNHFYCEPSYRLHQSRKYTGCHSSQEKKR